jgi:hypothetical protein
MGSPVPVAATVEMAEAEEAEAAACATAKPVRSLSRWSRSEAAVGKKGKGVGATTWFRFESDLIRAEESDGGNIWNGGGSGGGGSRED